MLGIVQASLKSSNICLSNDLTHGQVYVDGAQRSTTACVRPLFDQYNFVAKKKNYLGISEPYHIFFKAANS